MANKPTPRTDNEAAASRYVLGRPLPLLTLSEIRLNADQLAAMRTARLTWVREWHRMRLTRLNDKARQSKHRAALQRNDKSKAAKLLEIQELRKIVLRLTEQYKKREAAAQTWVPDFSCADNNGGISLDPIKFDSLGTKLDGYLQHIPSLFSVGWIERGHLIETMPQSSTRPVARGKKSHDERVLMRQQMLKDGVFKEWVLEIYETFHHWFPLTNRGRRTKHPTPFHGGLMRRRKPKRYTVQVVNHYIPGLNLTEGYIDKLLKTIPHGEVRQPDEMRTADVDLPNEDTTAKISPLRVLEVIEQGIRPRKHVRVVRGKS